MKKIIFILIASCSFVTAQNFVGTLTYVNTDTGEAMKYFTPYIPGSYDIYFDGTNVAMKYYGGMFNQIRFSFIPKKNEGMVFIDSLKIYNVVKSGDLATPKKEIVEKMDETDVIMGHTCTKYKIWEDNPDYKNIHYVWVASDMLINNSDILNEVGGEAFISTLPYAVLKIETIAGLHYEVKNISTGAPDPELFKVPKGYKLEKKLFQKVDDKKGKKN